jgi:uncharacterized protein with PQ loop repeat
MHLSACGGRPLPLSSACDASQLLKSHFYCVVESVTSSFSIWDDVGAMVRRWQHFFFPLIPLKFVLVMQNFRVAPLFVKISTSVLIFFIFKFCFWLFYKVLISFQLHPLFLICDMLFFFNLILILFYFFNPFVKLTFLFNSIL